MKSHRWVLRWLLAGSLACLAFAGRVLADEPVVERANLRSVRGGDDTAFHLPLDNRTTIVVVIDPAQSLVPMELIRGLRLVEQFGDRIRLAVVFVGERAATPSLIDSALEQESLLEMGLKSTPKFSALADRSGEWFAEVGRPTLPHAMLLGGDGAILGREILVGPFAEESNRIERALDSTKPLESPSDSAEFPAIAEAVRGAPLLAVSSKGAKRTRRQRATNRLDVKRIVQQLHSSDDALAREAVLGYCDSAMNFSLARRFAEAALEQFDAERCEPARQVIASGAEGWVSGHHYQLEAALHAENESPTLRMSVQWNRTLTSRWNNTRVAHARQGVLLGPGSDIFVTTDKFQSVNAGWGDYVIHHKVELTMSEGEYPDSRELPTLTREWDEFASFFPRNEYADEDETIRTSDLASVDALRGALSQALRAVDSNPSIAMNQDPADLVEDAVSGVAQAFGSLAQRLSGPTALAGKPFAGLKIQSWVQGQDQLGMEGPGRLTAPKGRVMLIDFMFVECPPCRAALPGLTKLHETHRERGLVIVSAVTSWGAKGMYGLAERKKLTHPVAVLAANEEKALGVTAFPTYVLVDRQGKIRWAGVGGEPDEAMIEKLLKESP